MPLAPEVTKLFEARRGGYFTLVTPDELARFFPGRAELSHDVFRPYQHAAWGYHDGEIKTPNLVVEPLIQIEDAERQAAAAEYQTRRRISKGSLVGHRLHVFEKEDFSQAQKIARVLSRFFKHDVQIVKHYNY